MIDQKPRVLPAAAIRGGNWDNGTNAGVFAFNVNNAPSNWNNNIGFRCRSSNTSAIFGGGIGQNPALACKCGGELLGLQSVTCSA